MNKEVAQIPVRVRCIGREVNLDLGTYKPSVNYGYYTAAKSAYLAYYNSLKRLQCAEYSLVVDGDADEEKEFPLARFYGLA